MQINIFANELACDLGPCPIGTPARSRAVHSAKARFVGEHDAQAAATSGGSWPELASRQLESRVFKSVLSRRVALGMKRTRHQFTPAMPVQKIVDGAVAGRMPNRLLISRLEILDVRISPAPAALAKHPNKAFSAESVMFSRWRPPIGFGLSSFSPPPS